MSIGNQSARTKVACDIAGIQPGRLNEAVHFGHYTCAPETVPGAARTFCEDDIVALRIYVTMLCIGLPSELAGKLADGCFTHIRYRGDVASVSAVWCADTVQFMSGDVQVDGADATITINIKAQRDSVRKKLADIAAFRDGA